MKCNCIHFSSFSYCHLDKSIAFNLKFKFNRILYFDAKLACSHLVGQLKCGLIILTFLPNTRMQNSVFIRHQRSHDSNYALCNSQ